MASALSLPLAVRGNAIGALNLYSATEGNYAGLATAAEIFAEQAAIVLANAQAYASANSSTTISRKLCARARSSARPRVSSWKEKG